MRELTESIRALRQRVILEMMVAPGDHATYVTRARIIDRMIRQDPELAKWFNAVLQVYVN